jgi:hypothetical protein
MDVCAVILFPSMFDLLSACNAIASDNCASTNMEHMEHMTDTKFIQSHLLSL